MEEKEKRLELEQQLQRMQRRHLSFLWTTLMMFALFFWVIFQTKGAPDVDDQTILTAPLQIVEGKTGKKLVEIGVETGKKGETQGLVMKLLDEKNRTRVQWSPQGLSFFDKTGNACIALIVDTDAMGEPHNHFRMENGEIEIFDYEGKKTVPVIRWRGRPEDTSLELLENKKALASLKVDKQGGGSLTLRGDKKKDLVLKP